MKYRLEDPPGDWLIRFCAGSLNMIVGSSQEEGAFKAVWCGIVEEPVMAG